VSIDPVVWILGGLILLIAEVVAPSLFFWPLGIAAIVSGTATLLGVRAVEWQLAIFIAASAGLLLLTRTAARRYLLTASPHLRTNVDAIPGQRAIALAELTPGGGSGQVRLHGMEWLAQNEGDAAITVGTGVRISRVDGITLVVRAEER
jgi:inner membrane protein